MDALGINLPGLVTQIISFGILFFILLFCKHGLKPLLIERVLKSELCCVVIDNLHFFSF